jgi:hypothetical protein
MSNRTGRWLALLAGVTVGCSKLPDRNVAGPVQTEALPEPGSIPTAWGKLVSVTVNPSYPDVFQLWLQDSSGTIHFVVYQAMTHRLSPTAPVITRK